MPPARGPHKKTKAKKGHHAEAPRAAAMVSENVSAFVLAARDAEKCIEYLHGALRRDGFWEPSPPLAGFLSLPLPSFELGHVESNAVWCTVLVLVHCMTTLLEYHADWRPLAEKARKWLFAQRFFTAGTTQLVKRACSLFPNDVDYKAMLATIFARAGDGAADETPAQRGNWVQLVLETPPYTTYYWNQVTRETRWEHPFDPHVLTPDEVAAAAAAAEAKAAQDERIAAVLPQRIRINRTAYMAPRPTECESCGKGVVATVLCVACDEYECDDCCDAIHMNVRKAHHIRESFRFVSCYGQKGLPYVRPSARTHELPPATSTS